MAEGPLLLNGDMSEEAAENTWSLGVGVDDSLVAADVVAAFEKTARLLGERVAATGKTATFYVWHDQQAGQLRCSTTSLPLDGLPFGAKVDPAVPLTSIVEGFLTDPGGSGAWDELHEVDEMPEFVLPVWAVKIG
ncbi:hypothetical protein ACWGE0_30440 [Lentzea sp. NPDC054927]